MLSAIRGVTTEALSGLRYAISCTAPLHESIKEQFEDRFGIPVLQSYGLCETLITTIEDPGHPAPNSAGKAVGKAGAVSISRNGEIVISNGAHFAGYLDGNEQVKIVEPYRTGDTGHLDDSQNLHITGRLSEVINVNGVKFSPETVESAINDLPGVTERAVVGYEASSHQTKIAAMVVGESVEAIYILENLRKRLSSEQIPHEIKPVDSLPKTANGKIDRVALRRSISI